MGGPWSATGQAAGTISARPHLPHAQLSGDRLRCSWAGPEESHPDLAAHVGPPLPPHQARPAPILPSLDPSRSRSHSEDHRRPLPLTLPALWTWAQPRPAQLPRAEAPDQVPEAMPSPVRAIPTSTAAATTPSLSSPPLTFTYHPPLKTTCICKLKFENEHSTATLENSLVIPREAGHRGTI